MAKTVLEELLIGLGYDYDDDDVKKFSSDVENLTNTITGLVKMAAAGAAAITSIVTASTSASDAQGKLARQIDISVEQLSALEYATERSGGSTGSLRSELLTLSTAMAEAREGTGTGLEVFGRLGISLTNANGSAKTVNQTLFELSDRIQGLNSQQQINFLSKLGLNDTTKLLQEGSDSIAELTQRARALGVTTAEDAAIAAEYQDTLTDFWVIIKQISRTITKEFAPMLTEINKKMAQWWINNKAFIQQNLGDYLKQVYQYLKLAGIALLAFTGYQALSGLATMVSAMRKISLSALFMSASIAAIPLLIALIGLAMEDAHTFFKGGESVFGDLLKDMPVYRDEILAVSAIFGTMSEITTMIVSGWREIFSIFKNFSQEKLKEFGKNLPGFLGEVTGLHTLDGTGLIQQGASAIANSSTANTIIDKVEIIVDSAAAAPEVIADAIYNKFKSVSDNFSTPVTQ